ncbi:MAG: ADP-forming succinate--CoA ligase subunit beta [Candidatus Methanoperedens sp.]|nr:ADP-forming succinate--CoA ligase subunit beta [Candidatus Methanoperedens sp.]MCE8429446.1 ADP-forming succinate--CoA ligase subunit beta [Candidatus Methanoperedens sp.]
MKLYEYAGKEIFSRYGISVPKGSTASSIEEAGKIAGAMGKSVIKAQVLAGGRGKTGGVLFSNNEEEARQAASRILGLTIKGLSVKKVLIEEFKETHAQIYLGITIDRLVRCPVIIASIAGGIDIEETAVNSPEKIIRINIDPLTGLHDYQARKLAISLKINDTKKIIDVIKKLYRIFVDNDCILAEINPLAQTDDGIYALDAKMVIDDNALFRHNYRDEDPDPLSEMAKKNGMSYVGLDGDIGCIVNGAGLAMATLDMIKQRGGESANFMDVRAGANEEQIKTALRIVSSNKKVKGIVVNIFGGLTKCDDVARGIIDILPDMKVPLVVRFAGTNEELGHSMLEKYGVTLAGSTEEAAKAVIRLVNPH